MTPWLITIISALCGVLASSGFWAFVMSKQQRNDALAQAVRGLCHDRIMELGSTYCQRGWITHDEFENLNEYLFKPYKGLNGNGTADKMMKEIDRLPFKDGISYYGGSK